MYFKVIRVAGDYSMAVLCASERQDPDPDDPGNVYYLYNSNGRATKGFEQVDKRSAMMMFAGIADGLGFGEFPEGPFTSLAQAERWGSERRLVAHEALLESIFQNPTSSERTRTLVEPELRLCRAALAKLRQNVPTD